MEDSLNTLKGLFGAQKNSVNLEQFKDILKQSGQFVLEEQEHKLTSYFNILDKDRDGLISFQDFLTPYLPQLTPEYVHQLLQNERITAENFTKLRDVYNETSSNKVIDLIEALTKHQDPALTILMGQIVNLYPSNDSIDSKEFSTGLSKLEKRFLQQNIGGAYLVGNRNLIEFTLTLKEFNKQKNDEGQENQLNMDDEQFDNTTNLSVITDLINQSKESEGKKTLNPKEVQAIELLQMNYNILQSEFQSLKDQNSELLSYKSKYEKLQRDVQNNLISSSGDEVLLQFKEQSERQLSLIELLKNELERIKKENNVYKRYTKSQNNNISGEVLQRLIQKSQQEFIDLKNVQLKKIEKQEEEKSQELVHQKSEVIAEDSTSVSKLANLFGGTAAHEKAFQKSMTEIEQELQKGKLTTDETKAEIQLTAEEQVILLNEKGYSNAQMTLEKYLIDPKQRFKTIGSLIGSLQKEKSVSLFTPVELEKVNTQILALGLESEALKNIQYVIRDQDSYRITSRTKKQNALLILTNENLYVFNINLELHEQVSLKNIESVVLSGAQNQVLALHSFDKVDFLLELGDKRTEFLINLIAIAEAQELDRFKVYVSNTVLIKEEFNMKDASLAKPIKAYYDAANAEADGEQEEDAKVSDEQGTESYFETLYRENYQEVEKYQKQCDELKSQVLKIDKKFVQQVNDNVYIRCVRVGLIWKKTQKLFKGWTEKFCVITNAGMVYFNTKKKGDFDPRKFFPLNDFQIKDVEEKSVKRKYAFKIIFERKEVSKDVILAANSQLEKDQWIIALKEHQRQFLDARIQVYQFRLQQVSK